MRTVQSLLDEDGEFSAKTGPPAVRLFDLFYMTTESDVRLAESLHIASTEFPYTNCTRMYRAPPPSLRWISPSDISQPPPAPPPIP